MIIKKLNIKSFGKLKNIKIQLKPGLNIIYGTNEAGKSTMQHFMKAMFYGMNSLKKNIRDNERKRFMPWDGSRTEGSLIFEDDNGKEYVIERSFGNQKKEDEAVIYNWITGEKAVHMDNYFPGNEIIGLGEEAFEKTLFIKQLGAKIDRDKDDEIMKRLINLHESGEEDTSYHKAEMLLEAYKKSIISTRKNGRMDELQEKINALKDEKVELEKLYCENVDDSLRLNSIKASIEKIGAEIEILQKEKNSLRIWMSNVNKNDAFNIEEIQDIDSHIQELKDRLNDETLVDYSEVMSSIENEFTMLKDGTQELENLKLQHAQIQNEKYALQEKLIKYKGFQDLEENIELKFANIQGDMKEKQERLKTVQELHVMQLSLQGEEAYKKRKASVQKLTNSKRQGFLSIAVGSLLVGLGILGAIKASALLLAMGVLGFGLILYAVIRLDSLNKRNREIRFLEEEREHQKESSDNEEKEILSQINKLNKYLDFLLNHCDCVEPEEFYEKLRSYKALENKDKQMEVQLGSMESDIVRKGERLLQLKAELEKDILGFETDIELAQLNSKHLALEKEKKDIEYNILMRIKGKRELWMVDGDIAQCLSEVEELKLNYNCANIAEKVMKEAFEEIQQNFAPQLNSEVGAILSGITRGKYEEVKISSDYEINILESNNRRELDYFSSGTLDQIYLALRLGLCNMIFQHRQVPIIMDDAFTQYDAKRLDMVMKFLKSYSMTHQVIIFTCRELPGYECIDLDELNSVSNCLKQ